MSAAAAETHMTLMASAAIVFDSIFGTVTMLLGSLVRSGFM